MAAKTTSVLIILLAYIILLAHDVVPHHHHNGVIAIKNSTVDHDHEHEHSENNNKGHKHNNEDHSCILKQAVIIPANQVKNIYSNLTRENELLNSYFLLFYSDFNIPDFISFIKTRYKPPLISHYLSRVNHIKGLRAPPTI